jgi:hypothetical protein
MKIHMLALLTLASCASAAQVTLERVPENGLQPQVAVESDGTAHLVYLTGKPESSDIHYVKRRPHETAWSAPIAVNSEPKSAVAVGTIRGAQLAIGRGHRVHIVWNGRSEKGGHASAPLCYTRLEEGKFAVQRTLNTGTLHLDGGASVAADDKGAVFVVWHAAPPNGKNESDRRIFFSHSRDDGATFTAAAVAPGSAPGVCACCSLKAFIAPEGTLLTLYRNASSATQRDMILLSSREVPAFSPAMLHPWSIAACPMSSAALISSQKSTRAAWESDGMIYSALLAEKPQPLALSRSKARHPSLAVNNRGETLVAWSVGTGWQRGGKAEWTILDTTGRPSEIQNKAVEVPVWSHTAAFATAAGDFVILH